MSVPVRISIVTLGVDNLARSKAFYEALGWELVSAVGDEICWFRTSDSYLGLFGREDLAKDAGLRSEPRRSSAASRWRSASGARRPWIPLSPMPSPQEPGS